MLGRYSCLGFIGSRVGEGGGGGLRDPRATSEPWGLPFNIILGSF